MKDKIKEVVESIKDIEPILQSKNAVLGFDGFIDQIMRVISRKKDKNNFTFFNEIEEFGSYLVSKKGKSCTIELHEHVTKIGGNMPILAAALGKMGVNINCIGAMGYPEIKNEFKDMLNNNCTIYSITNPGITTALEFNDGKVMLAQMEPVDCITWDRIKIAVGINKLIELFNSCDLLGIVNWSEVENSSAIWEGILKEIIPHHKPNTNQIMLFDLSDCSKRSIEDIKKAIFLINEFSNHYKVVLGMNENEAKIVFEALFSDDEYVDFINSGDKIYEALNIDMLVIHPRNCSAAWDKSGSCKIDNFYVEQPKISTGGGDNFNAGFCTGQLLGLDKAASLIVANAVSGFYVKNGHSPDNKELLNFLEEWQLIF